MAIEEPKFTIETKNEVYEIRKYESTLVAETKVTADFDEAGNKAFRILANYIFGNNKSKTKIEMTAPVSQQSEKIEMTAPVTMTKENTDYLVQFTMPASFTMETLPLPMDQRVIIREIPARRVAVYSYSGSWSQKRFNTKLEIFKSALNKDGLTILGDPIFARFNSPFQLWFLRRNEIWIEVASK
ncbi:MAG: SOUL family heme-binding protein [Pseudobdellovibrionaceae bacterium]